jgi:hypothetical protein
VHLLFTYGVWPSLIEANLVAAVAMFFTGLALRWIRRASVVLAITCVFSLFFFVYVGGIAPTFAYLTLSGHRDWIPWAALASCALYAAFLTYRVRATLRAEWAQPLDGTPGLHISRADGTLWRESGQHDQRVMSRAAVAMLVLFGPLLYFAYGTPAYLFILFVLCSHCLGLLTSCAVSWWVAYFLVVRQWEQQAGIGLRVPPLQRRRGQAPM